MKTNFVLAIAIIVATSLSVNAQPKRMQPYSGKSPKEATQVLRPDGFTKSMESLDEKQREEMKKIRTAQLKESVQTRNRLKEKRAKLELLQTADKPDMKEINKVIDEIASIQAQEMKAQAASRQKIRSLLTEEQRIYFDAQNADRGSSNRRDLRPEQNNRTPDEPRFQGQRGVRFQTIERQQPVERPQRGERPQRPMNRDSVSE